MSLLASKLNTYFELRMQRVQHGREVAMTSSAMAEENIFISRATIHLTGKRFWPENSTRNTLPLVEGSHSN